MSRHTLIKFLALTFSLFLFSSCKSHPVYAESTNGERFVGSFTGYAVSRSGTLTMNNARGVTCDGSFDENISWDWKAITGYGTLRCNDGRTGSFNFAGNKKAGQGFGEFSDGNKFNFQFGQLGFIAQ